jgi:hypothetical protein
LCHPFSSKQPWIVQKQSTIEPTKLVNWVAKSAKTIDMKAEKKLTS